MKGCVVVGLGAVLVVYITIGGLVFRALEQEEELAIKHTTNNITRDFLRNYSCVSEEELGNLIATIIAAYQNNVLPSVNETSNLSTWELRNSMFFSATVVTTIGYGNQTPSTWQGRLFCVFYALLGIPLCLIFLASVGDRIYKINKWLAYKINCCPDPTLDRIGDFVVISVLGMCIFLLLPAGIFAYVEGWSYGIALYYCVITLSTVGFGDFVAGDGATELDQRGWYRFALIFWILVGMAWFAGCISAVQNTMEKNIEIIQEEIEEEFGNSQSDSDSGNSATDSINISNPNKSGETSNGTAMQFQCQMLDQSTHL